MGLIRTINKQLQCSRCIAATHESSQEAIDRFSSTAWNPNWIEPFYETACFVVPSEQYGTPPEPKRKQRSSVHTRFDNKMFGISNTEYIGFISKRCVKYP